MSSVGDFMVLFFIVSLVREVRLVLRGWRNFNGILGLRL